MIYRTRSIVQTKPPRAPLWRRILHRHISARIEVQRLRHRLHIEYPWATWRELHELATLSRSDDTRPIGDMIVDDLAAYLIRSRILAREPADHIVKRLNVQEGTSS